MSAVKLVLGACALLALSLAGEPRTEAQPPRGPAPFPPIRPLEPHAPVQQAAGERISGGRWHPLGGTPEGLLLPGWIRDIGNTRAYSDVIAIHGPPPYAAYISTVLDEIRTTQVGGRLFAELADLNRWHQSTYGTPFVVVVGAFTKDWMTAPFAWLELEPPEDWTKLPWSVVEVSAPMEPRSIWAKLDPVPYWGQIDAAVPTLFHELLHALHMGDGESDPSPDPSDRAPGHQGYIQWALGIPPVHLGGPMTANIEEGLTIGRGPFANTPLSENALRRELGQPERDTWFAKGVCHEVEPSHRGSAPRSITGPRPRRGYPDLSRPFVGPGYYRSGGNLIWVDGAMSSRGRWERTLIRCY